MTKRSMRWALTAAALLGAAPFTLAQTSGSEKRDPVTKDPPAAPQSPRRIKSVRKSVVDLEQQAKERRPGQVMPGDPAPVGRTPAPAGVPNATEGAMEASSLPTPAPTPASSAKGAAIALPDTAPSNRAIIKPSGESSGRTNSIAPPPPPPAPPTPAAPEASAVHAAAPAPSAAHAEPLPAMEESKPEMPAKAQAAEVAVALVDKSIVPNIPMALSTGPAKLRIETLSGDTAGVQWRAPGESWRTPVAGETTESKIEVRAGLDSDLIMVVDERVQIRISRLGRALIERSEEGGGTTAVCITLSRGAVEVRALKDAALTPGEMFARIRTPDQMFGVTGALRVEYDAFTGTRRRTITP